MNLALELTTSGARMVYRRKKMIEEKNESVTDLRDLLEAR